MLEQIIKLTKKLIRCPSISPNDEGCQDILINFLKKLDFKIDTFNIKDTKNFWAYHFNNKNNFNKTLVFAGHTDVVPPGGIDKWKFNPFEAIIKNNILYGRGSCDMKGALAAMLFAAKKFITKYNNYSGRLAFLITSDEEGDGKNGMVQVIQKLINKKEQFNFCILGEPTSNKFIGDNIKNGRRGSLNIKLKIIGIQGHVAYHELATNPIHIIVPFLNELLSIKWDHKTHFLPQTSMQITNINTSMKNSNIIPGEITLLINFRFNENNCYKNILKIFNNIIKKYIKNYEITWQLSGLPFLSIKNSFSKEKNLLDVVKNSINVINRINPTVVNNGGTSDGRFIIKTGAQIIELGLLNSTIHKVNECVNVHDLYKIYNIYYQIIKQILIY
ncbi:succinyl-diaminopimelate desuccinylase [Enterobacteriaceae endosymbiont of Donacia tomentosa]|uniref:succinyl-diaminopimelate desuccinylase n=1 Tax=Enterobacteriaceae endosymbiont of Donacia tomentosa TaxID=2675787 RepID=UPI00144A2995|nr:succinyl-diaminopimelate desuccinylase [Enterobacteriaceae endosymbiont of Donacia tomentosa]QJC31650.1 succinyl-diaminopimelate desuccinylase [Enterobacteriaceae endosymbiont of Donacia tomentosa]